MTERVTSVGRHINAPPDKVYETILDAKALPKWKVPDDMTMHVHAFDARPGGTFRISLTYDAPGQIGKTTSHTDTYHGRFVELVPNTKIVEEEEFESTDPQLAGTMTSTITLTESNGGTDLRGVHRGVPAGVSLHDNEIGWKMSLDKLAKLVEDR